MDINANVDFGPNIAKVLAAIGEKLGLTADHIMAVYVKQQAIYGWTILALILLAFAFGVVIIYASRNKRFDTEAQGVIFGLGLYICIVTLFIAALNATDVVGCIFNPEYRAFQELLRDVSKLVK